MGEIICYSRFDGFRKLNERRPDSDVILVETSEELAHRLVETSDLLCAIIHLKEPDEFWNLFLSSLRSSFPLMSFILVLEKGTLRGETPFTLVRGSPEDSEVFMRIEDSVASLEKKNLRDYNRFDWPLNGSLRFDDAPERSFRVRAISASGCFLESAGPIPESGTLGTLRIEFQDFSVLTGCEVLPARPATETLPAGFGVRFTDLTEGSRKVIDHIVRDELIRSLIRPEVPPRPPSVSEQ